MNKRKEEERCNYRCSKKTELLGKNRSTKALSLKRWIRKIDEHDFWPKTKMCNMRHKEREKPQVHKRFKHLLENFIGKYIATKN